MKRFILFDFEQRATSERRKALIIRGARQVGKTWARKYGLLPAKRLQFIPLYFAFSATGGAGQLR